MKKISLGFALSLVLQTGTPGICVEIPDTLPAFHGISLGETLEVLVSSRNARETTGVPEDQGEYSAAFALYALQTAREQGYRRFEVAVSSTVTIEAHLNESNRRVFLIKRVFPPEEFVQLILDMHALLGNPIARVDDFSRSKLDATWKDVKNRRLVSLDLSTEDLPPTSWIIKTAEHANAPLPKENAQMRDAGIVIMDATLMPAAMAEKIRKQWAP